jgi:hypothetical protein
MKPRARCIIICLCLLPSIVLAQKAGIAWNGYLQSDNRIYLLGDNNFSWHEHRLNLRAELSLFEKTHFYSELWVRSLGFPKVGSSADLDDNNILRPLNLDLREAYIDIYGFVLPDLDIRLGRQRIAWGTGDKINPTDNLNPHDLEDIWDFGRHLGSDGMLASLYAGGYTFSAAVLPFFTPAVLPVAEWTSMLYGTMEMPAGLQIASASDSIIMPANNLRETFKGGLKIKKQFFGYDIALSYVYGLDDLPVVTKATIVPTGNIGEVDISTELIYPKMHIVGFDIAGAMGTVGVWAEAAMFVPERVNLITDLTALGMGIQESIALDNEPYVKFLLGADYTFKNGLYLNIQYLHGFVHERGWDDLRDYVMFGSEWNILNSKVKIMPLAGAIAIADFDALADNYAVVYTPELAYMPFDNAELSVGTRWIAGSENTIFGQLRDNDEIYFKVKYSF